MLLYVMRHGETTWNVEKRLQGKSNIPLNENGIELAKITAEAIKDFKIDEIYSSPLNRAVETANIINEYHNCKITIDPRLEEMGFGIYEGLASGKIPADFKAFFKDPENYVPAPKGESFESLISRARDFIDTVVIPKSRELEAMMIVAHGAMNNSIALNLLHRELKDFWEGIFPANCSISIYDINENDFKLVEYAKKFY